jgi:pimeloyl-ACP methyl ester carboxylesterase
MPKVRVNDRVELYYESFGEGEPLLLIMGIGAQLVIWEEEFCQQLASRGFRVIRFDNRDVGLSTRLDELRAPNMNKVLMARVRGRPAASPYTLDDMARDTFGLMDALGIDRAHVVGLSLGGMIAQCMALLDPKRVRSLGIIMSSPGDLWTALPKLSALQVLLKKPENLSREGVLENFVKTWGTIGASPHRTSSERLQVLAGLSYDRGMSARGFARQFAALMAAPPRSKLLRKVRVPTVVLHGALDPLIPHIAGRLVASQIPGARLEVIQGMGHDLGPSVWPFAIDALVQNSHRELAAGAKPMGMLRAFTQRAVHI